MEAEDDVAESWEDVADDVSATYSLLFLPTVRKLNMKEILRQLGTGKTDGRERTRSTGKGIQVWLSFLSNLTSLS